jgi:hypothetical protein
VRHGSGRRARLRVTWRGPRPHSLAGTTSTTLGSMVRAARATWRWTASDTGEWRRCERKRMGEDPYQCFLFLPSNRPASSAVPPHVPASAAARPCSSAHTRSLAPCLAVAARTSVGDGAAARARARRWRELCEGRGSIAFVRARRLCGDEDEDSGFLFYWTRRGLRLPFARPGERRSVWSFSLAPMNDSLVNFFSSRDICIVCRSTSIWALLLRHGEALGPYPHAPIGPSQTKRIGEAAHLLLNRSPKSRETRGGR